MCKMTQEEIAAMSNKDLAEFLKSHVAASMIYHSPQHALAKSAVEAAHTQARREISAFISKEVERGSCDPVEFEEVAFHDRHETRAHQYVIPPAVVREIIERLSENSGIYKSFVNSENSLLR